MIVQTMGRGTSGGGCSFSHELPTYLYLSRIASVVPEKKIRGLRHDSAVGT